jgi:hypothetical protein
MKLTARRPLCTLVAITMLVSIVATPFDGARAGTAADDLKQIEYKYYFRGKYQQAIESLQVYLARVDLTQVQATRAREVLAASYVLGGAPAMGKQVFSELVARNPSYAGPDPSVFKLEVLNAYAEARAEQAALALQTAPRTKSKQRDDRSAAGVPADAATAQAGKPIYKQWWLYAGAAAVLLAAGLAVGGGGDEDTPPAPTGTVTVGVTVH